MMIPFIQYRDAPKAIHWLEKAFGFKPHLVAPGEAGMIAHAQLLLGDKTMLMASSVKDCNPKQDRPKDEFGSAAGIYVVVSDPDVHYQQAKSAGAEMVMPIADQDYGGRAFTCLDIEGNLWSFGSYDPFAEGG